MHLHRKYMLPNSNKLHISKKMRSMEVLLLHNKVVSWRVWDHLLDLTLHILQCDYFTCAMPTPQTYRLVPSTWNWVLMSNKTLGFDVIPMFGLDVNQTLGLVSSRCWLLTSSQRWVLTSSRRWVLMSILRWVWRHPNVGFWHQPDVGCSCQPYIRMWCQPYAGLWCQPDVGFCLPNFNFQPKFNICPTLEVDVIPIFVSRQHSTSVQHWRLMSTKLWDLRPNRN